MAKISIKIASKGNTSFDLSSNHLTTTDFGQLQVSHFLPVVPNDKIQCNVGSEARFAPMVVPTFMDCKLITRAFYVPMSAIYQNFEYFYTDRQDASCYKDLPYILNSDFVAFMTNSQYDYVRAVPAEFEADFTMSGQGYIFTERGRIAMKLFHSLGYSFNWSSSDTTPMSLLPLLAFMRVCYDYIYPAQYLDGLGLTKYFKISSQADMANVLGSASLINSFLASCISLLHLPFKQDYFTAAWRSLNAPGTSHQLISASSVDGQQTVASKQGTVDTTALNSGNLSQYALNLMQRMYDFVTRNNIVGVRYADQLFARFGIGSRKSDPDMSQLLGEHIQNINVVDVTAMSAAQGQDLGDLAGKAYLQGSGHLYSFDSVDEFGYILCLSFVMPHQGYYQGRKRWITQFGRFDFYHPEFDMQMRAIRNDEVFADYIDDTDYSNGQNYGGNPANRFGFAPNYSEFKKGDDYLTGDFRVNSLRRNLDSYYLLRDIKQPNSSSPLALNADFLFMQQHEYDKIFAQVYALRAPITLMDVNLLYGRSIICYEDRPIVLLWDTSDVTQGGWLLFVNDGKVKPVYYTYSLLQSSSIVVDLDDNSTYYAPSSTTGTVGTASNVVLWDIVGILYNLRTVHGLVVVTTSYTPSVSDTFTFREGTSLRSTYSVFISKYQDYIDHIYLKHHFNIQASRSMVPISEEFMIDDGGNRVSVDMNGNRIV